jgi:succinate dehydrogenase / fumarate reductase, cytochrome b subunit
MADTIKPRPGANMKLIDALGYKLPVAGVVSILHRVSGLLMFFLLPFVIWLFDMSVSSQPSFERFTAAFSKGAWLFPGWFVKLVCLALIWAFLHHLIAGVRHLWMDATHSVTKKQGRVSALVTMVSSILLTLVLMAKLFGWF